MINEGNPNAKFVILDTESTALNIDSAGTMEYLFHLPDRECVRKGELKDTYHRSHEKYNDNDVSKA